MHDLVAAIAAESEIPHREIDLVVEVVAQFDPATVLQRDLDANFACASVPGAVTI